MIRIGHRDLEECGGCSGKIHRDEQVSAVFAADGNRTFFHRDCEVKIEHFVRWNEETPWIKPVRMSVKEWTDCSNRKHLGVWQSVFNARRDDDVWCPDCGLKIARQEHLTCPKCNGQVIITNAELTKSHFMHGEPLYKLQLYCTQNGETSSASAIVSGFTPVTVTGRLIDQAGSSHQDHPSGMLKYQPKGDPAHGLKV